MHTETLKTFTGKIKVTIPETLMELTVGQLIAIQQQEEINDLRALAILSGADYEHLKQLNPRELEKVTQRILSLTHQIQYAYKDKDIPKYVSFGTHKVKRCGFYFERDHKVKVADNLSVEPAGAFMASKDIIADEINRHIELYGEDNWHSNFAPLLDNIAMVLAHYFYCRVTGNPYNEQKAEAFKSEILKLPVQVALPIGSHFFLNYPDLLQQRVTLWQVFRQTWRNKLALQRLKNSRGTTA